MCCSSPAWPPRPRAGLRVYCGTGPWRWLARSRCCCRRTPTPASRPCPSFGWAPRRACRRARSCRYCRISAGSSGSARKMASTATTAASCAITSTSVLIRPRCPATTSPPWPRIGMDACGSAPTAAWPGVIWRAASFGDRRRKVTRRWSSRWSRSGPSTWTAGSSSGSRRAPPDSSWWTLTPAPRAISRRARRGSGWPRETRHGDRGLAWPGCADTPRPAPSRG